jgi:hypothetical protein
MEAARSIALAGLFCLVLGMGSSGSADQRIRASKIMMGSGIPSIHNKIERMAVSCRVKLGWRD